MFDKKEDFIGAENIITFKQICVRQPQAILAVVEKLIKERDALKVQVEDLSLNKVLERKVMQEEKPSLLKNIKKKVTRKRKKKK